MKKKRYQNLKNVQSSAYSKASSDSGINWVWIGSLLAMIFWGGSY